MAKIKKHEIVKTPDGRFGEAVDFKKKKAVVVFYDEETDLMETAKFAAGELEVVPCKVVSEADLRAFFRREKPYEEILRSDSLENRWRLSDEMCVLTLDDALVALRSLARENATAETVADWVAMWAVDADEGFSWGATGDCYESEPENPWLPLATEDELLCAMNASWRQVLLACLFEELESDATGFMDFNLMMADIAQLRAGNTETIKSYRWSALTRETSALELTDDDLTQLNKMDLAIYRATLEQLCAEGDLTALETWAYAHYGDGNVAYEPDYAIARDTLLKLMDSPEVNGERKGVYANTLGYINYYGFANGTPDYDAAFKYFSIGLFSNGMYESAYKLADLFLAGKGTLKSEEAAFSLLVWDFDQCRHDFCEGGWGDINNKFADVALRLARFYRDGIVVEQDPQMAYTLLTQAQYAIEMRQIAGTYVGDTKVAATIRKELGDLRASGVFDCESATWLIDDEPTTVPQLFANESYVYVQLKATKKGVKITASLMLDDEDDELQDVLITHPRHHYCELQNQVVEQAHGNVDVVLDEGTKKFKKTGKASFIANEVHTVRLLDNDRPVTFFLLDGVPVASVSADMFRFRVDWRGSEDQEKEEPTIS